MLLASFSLLIAEAPLVEMFAMSTSYTVRSGDTLGKIAAKHGFKDYREIYDHPANAGFKLKRPNPNLIFPGDIIVIPDKGAGAPPAALPPGGGASPTSPTRSCELPPSSIFSTWPPDLLETLCRSFRAHSASNRYLDNAFWAGEPTSFEDALNRLGGAVQTNALKWVHTRAAAISGVWPFISFMHNLWSGDSHGFAFTCSDKMRLRAFLDASKSFCRDIPLMMSDHQAAGPTQCWRETVTGTAGLHICIPIDDTADQSTVPGESSIHIDPHQIVKGKDADGTCSYSADGMVSHGRDVGAGVLRRKAEEIWRKIEKGF